MTTADTMRGAALLQRGTEDLAAVAAGPAGTGPAAECSLSTRFQIASVTKQFTAAAVLLLADRGVLSRADPGVVAGQAHVTPTATPAGHPGRHSTHKLRGLPGADMTELPLDSSRPHCQAGRGCDRSPCFQARLDATAGQYRVHKRTDLCAEHLGAAIQAITTWAQDEGLRGEVTVLAIDLSGSGVVTPAWDRSSLAFATIPITPFSASGGPACPRVYPPMDTSQADTNKETSGTSQEDGPPSRSAPWPNALSPVSLADRARSARLDWVSGRPARQQYREVRTLGEHQAAAVTARSATPPRTCHAI